MRMTLNQEARYRAYLEKLQEDEKLARIKVEEARKLGDLSENAEYDTANLDLSKIKNTISVIEEVLADTEIIEVNSNTNKVGIGTVLKLRYEMVDGIATGISSLDEGEWFEIVESSKILIPHSEDNSPTSATELPISSIVGNELFGKVIHIGSKFTYRDNDNITRTIVIMDISEVPR